MKAVFVTGGTGGHIYPALALANHVKEQGNEVVFIGNEDRMEATIVPQAGYPFYGLKSKGLARGIVEKGKAVLLLPMAVLKARNILKKEKCDICVGFGGYVTTPVILAAQSLKIKTILHEQNSIFGKANKIVAKNVDAIVTCYEDVVTSTKDNVYLLGNPRASEVVKVREKDPLFETLGLDEKKQKILIVMGSLGSTSVNAKMMEAVETLGLEYEIILVSGKQYYDETVKLYKDTPIHIVPYVNQLAMMDQVDLLIARAGATTAAEICAMGSVAILIPSPYVANNHQYYNALALYKAGAVEMLEEKELEKDNLETLIHSILNDQEVQKNMRIKAKELGKVNAAQELYDLMQRLVEESRHE